MRGGFTTFSSRDPEVLGSDRGYPNGIEKK
jgi:hypothetical protein